MYEPDVHHFHQLLFSFIERKFELSRNLSHLMVSTIINFYNLIIIMIGLNFSYQTNKLIFILLINVTFYSVFYVWLKKIKKNNL